MPLKPVDTALKIIVGPAIDDTDFKSREEALTYDQAGIEVDVILEKHDGTIITTAVTPTTAGDYDWTHTDQGYYSLELPASGGASFNNTEEGIITVAVFCTGVLPFGSISYDVVPTMVYNSLVKGTDVLTADITQIGGVAQSATDLKDLVDTGYDPGNHKIQSDLIYIHGSALTETAGQLAAAFVKLLDVSTPVLTAESVNQSANNNIILAHAEYGNAKLVRSTTPANALDVSATGEAGLDFDNIKNASGAHTLTNITVPTVTALTGKTGFSLLSTGADLILKDSTFALAIADAIWDAILTGATHNVATSAGRRLREVGAYAIHSGTAQAGNSVHITLAATASATDGIYNRNLLVLTDGTGASQTRTIIDYDGSTKIATIDREWRTNPDATSEYQIVADDTPLVVDQGVAQAGSTSSTIKIRAYASSTNDIYLCNIVIIVAGTGRGQARLVGAYDGTTKVVTLCGDNWVTTPDDTSVYVMIPYGATCTSCVGDDALAQIVAANIAGVTDGSYDLQEMMRIMFAVLSGKSSGGGTTTLAFRDVDDSKNRLSETVDGDGNRTAVTRDGT